MDPNDPSPAPADPPGDASSGRALGDSYRQARREMWVMLGAWAAFFLLVTTVCALTAYRPGGDAAQPVPLLLGMPRWVALGVAVPWLAANGFIVWFALRFMKDTPLPSDNADSPGS